MTDADLDKLEALAKAATPGPWEQSHREGDDEMYRTQVYTADGETIASLAWYPKDMGGGRIGTYREANAAFMAAANPATILDLIASARRDAEEIERLRARFAELADDFERRADACHELNKSDKEQRDRMRLHGKEAAYRHAMVLARAAHTGEG